MSVLERARDRLQRGWRWLKRRLRRSPLAQITQSEAVLTEVARHLPPKAALGTVQSRI